MYKIDTIAFDAYDTLWVNEIFFRESEERLAGMLAEFTTPGKLNKQISRSEMETLHFYGYGIKWFTLSLIDAALKVSDNRVPQEVIREILEMGKRQAQKPIQLLDGVHETLDALRGRYRLVMATKGDLAEQRRKIADSGLAHYFDHIEVMRDKKGDNYTELLAKLNCRPGEFMMVGNSMRSDILPVLGIGGHAVHIPSDSTWAHEHVEGKPDHANFLELERLSDVPGCPFITGS